MASETPRVAFGRLPYRTGVLGFVALGWFLFNAGRLLIPPLAVPIQDGLGIGNAAFGFAVSALWGSYALLQFFAGISTDTLGYKTVLVGSLLVVGPAFAVISFTDSYAVFLGALLVVGTAGSFFYIISRTLPAELYGDTKGRAIGLVTAAGNASGVVAPLVATAIIAYSWRAPFVAIGAGVLVVAGAFHLLVRGEYTFRRPAFKQTTLSAAAEIRKPGVPLMLLAYSAFAIAWQGSTAFMPLYFYETKGLSLGLANATLALFFLMGVIVKPLSGWLSDTVGRRPVSVGSLLGSGVAVGVLALVAESRLGIAVAVAAFGVTLLSFSPVMQAYLIEIFDDRNNASSFGLARTVYVLVGAAGPTLVGIGSETVGFTTTFTVMAGLLVVASVVLFLTTGRLAVETGGQ